ncbi:MAG: SUMF1/EgtB/PvdO family nonheme iron enzyme [Planctomycetes bacterium]|nr:SUMF1/EgtB/PvdO family nonheme iron enzyme [Planctomycetota bacterium]
MAAILRRNALRNRLVLLLDGLDEATVEGTAVKKLPKVLADIIQDFGAGAVVITTRPAGFVGDAGLRKELEVAAPGSFDVTTLEPLGDVEQVALVGKLVEAKCNSAPDLERIRLWLEEAFSDGQAQELRGNPLWLTLQALLFDPEKQAPGTLGELVERAIEALLRGEHNEQPEGQKTDRPPEHDVKRPPDAALPAVRALLAGVAERLTALGRESASFHELRALWSVLMDREPDGDEEKRAVRLFSQRLARHPLGKARPLTAGQSQMIATHLPDPFEFWRFVRLQTGVVVQPGAGFERSTEQNGTEEWRFWHRLFQEALAAESLAARWTTQKQEVLKTLEQALEKGTRRDRAERQGPSAWEETLVFLAGRLEHADDLAPLAKTLEDGQLSRFLAHARRLSRGRLLDLMKSAKEDERRGIVLEASPRLLKDRAEYETLRDRAQKAFEEFGAWCWFADEGLRRLEGREGWEWVKEARREWWRARAPENIEDLLTVQVGANRRRKTVTTWVDVPEGTFWMGSPEDDKGAVASEKPQHPVKMSTFRLWRTPVTLRQYRQFDPEHQDHWSKGARLPADEREDRPITDVSWWAAMAFSRWLGFWLSKCTSLEGTLPTEAQWEYACRGKSVGRAEEQTRFATGNDDSHLDECGWFTKNSDDRVHAVGRKRENGFDLFDTHGNVWEWCRDSWRTYVSSDEPIADPVGPTTGAGRAVRGGCCWVVARGCRSAYRNGFHVWDRDGDQGFRPVLPAAADCR